ncbi:MAG TPA: flagellar hook-length control protein FliK [Pyrinomonadaceae bacterium]|nr:flagellar hook-length control protein FliK [Pyrinomonadaceae bacterium]
MKIPSGSQNAQPRPATPDALRAGQKRGPADAPEGVDPPDSDAAARDFASVLDELAGAHEGERPEAETRGDRLEAEPKEHARESPLAKRREESKGDDPGADAKGGGFEGRAAPLREPTAAQEPTAARAMLHIADLERIVSAVRTQALADGAREVTIDLRRSVLEGLRVKLSSDGAGRVTAEFIAASERVRAQVDARASELADLMRSRGVNLAEVRASVSDSGADTRGGGYSAEAGEDAGGVTRVARASLGAQDSADAGALAEEWGTTYRG